MAETAYGPVITVSASYGTGGSIIAPRLAEELGIPFMDRLITTDSGLATRSQEGLTRGERETTPAGRFLSYFARAASVGAVVPPDPDFEDDDAMRARAEADLRPIAKGQPAVVLGRAGAVVLRDRPRAFHVRLDAPAERRVAWAAAHFESLDKETCARRQSETDKARTLFVKRLYRVDPRDFSLYHLMLDPTVIGVEATLQVISTAAGAYFEANP